MLCASAGACRGIYKLFTVVVIVILFYWFFLLAIKGSNHETAYVDPLNRIVVRVNVLENCCSWWPISHFILFFIIGLLFPRGCDLVAIGGGIVWELFEVCAYYTLNMDRQAVRSGSGVQYSGNWWAGSFKDLIFNTMGFYLGKTIAIAFDVKIQIPYLTESDKKEED